MQKKCEQCGEMFEAQESFYKKCPRCHSIQKGTTDLKPTSIPKELLLKTFYDDEGNLLKDIFVGKPQKISEILTTIGLTSRQLRYFHSKILNARNISLRKDIEQVRPILWECQKELAHQVKRNIIPSSFKEFMEYYLQLAEKDEKSLEGFYQHLDSIVCYFQK